MKRHQAILFIIDTQGANCVGCYRPDLSLRTPHVDALAAQGIRFERAYCCSPVCGPARSALLTGLFPHSNGVLGNDMAPHLNVPTMGQRVSDARIATGYIGKWHLDGTDYFGEGRSPAGWAPEYWFDGRNYLESLRSEAERRLSRRELSPTEIAAHGITAEFTHAHRIADRAIEFVREHRDQDFLLVVSIDEPHHPAIAPEPFASAFEDFLFPVPAADDSLAHKPRSQREWAEHTAPQWAQHLVGRNGTMALRHPRHFACNSYSDFEVGRILAAVDTDTPDALVAYTGDHGDMFGSHRLHGKGPCVYEEITRVPLIVRWPGEIPAGAVTNGLASHIDLTPTLLNYFGLQVPELLEGRSLLAQLRQPTVSINQQIFVEFHRFEVDHDGFGAFAPIRCVFDGRHKLAINLLDTDEFYDLERDPHELHNAIDDGSAVASRDRLHEILLDWMNATRDPLRSPHWRERPWNGDRQSSWGGPTRPRPFDQAYFPKTLLYDSGQPIDRREYEKL